LRRAGQRRREDLLAEADQGGIVENRPQSPMPFMDVVRPCAMPGSVDSCGDADRRVDRPTMIFRIGQGRAQPHFASAFSSPGRELLRREITRLKFAIRGCALRDRPVRPRNEPSALLTSRTSVAFDDASAVVVVAQSFMFCFGIRNAKYIKSGPRDEPPVPATLTDSHRTGYPRPC